MTPQPQPGNADPRAEQVARMVAFFRAGQADALESAWMEFLEDPAVSLADLGPVLGEVASQKNARVMESLLWLLLSVWGEQRGPDAALDAARQVAHLLPDTAALRDEVAGLCRAVHAGAPGIDTLLEMTVLRRDLAPAAALAAMDRLLALPPGTFVADSRRRSPGRVVGVETARKVLAVSFGQADRAYDALSVDALEVLAPDDFRALAVFDQARLEALARDDPAELVRLALRAYGPRLGMKDLKARLAPAVPADAWSKWWSAARAFVKRSPVIDVSEGPQPEFFLRHRAVAYEDTVRERYEAAAGLEEKLLVALGYLGEAGHNPQAEAAALGSFAADMAKWADASGGRSPAERLAAVVVLGEIRRHLGDQPCGTAGLPGRGDAASAVPTAGQAGRATSEPVSAASGAAAADDLLAAAPADLGPWAAAVRSDDLAGRVLAFIKERLPERWPGVFAAAMPAASMETCERIAGDLAAAGRLDLVAAAAAVCLRRPAPCLAALAWLWRNAAAEKFAPALGDLSRASMTVRLFQAINEVAMQDMPDRARKLELLGQARRTILHKEFAVLRDVLDRTDAAWAKEIRTAVSRNSGLSDHLRVQVLDVIGHAHPVPVARVLPPWEEDAVYTTPAALEARQKEFEDLVHVKLPANSAAIGAASAHGDVSDNAEFQAALEERGRLTERANAMQADIVRAKPIPRVMALSETVNIGTTVRARRASTGREETLTFLGPWDAAAEKGIYFYKAPLALAFMGKAVGETVVLRSDAGKERWEILEVRPAL